MQCTRLLVACALTGALTSMAHGQPDTAPAAADRLAEPPASGLAQPPTARGAGSAAPPSAEDYRSPKREACEREIEKDFDWFANLKDRYVDLYYFGAPTQAKAARDDETIPPNFQENYASAMRDECEAELGRDYAWRSSLQSYFGSLLALEYHTRNAGSFATNKRHVIMAYASIMVILVLALVGLFLRQRTLLEDIDRLRHDVDRAAAG